MKDWQRIGVSLAALLSLAACGGGGGDSGISTGGGGGGGDEIIAPTGISGQVADGYLAGAKVCLDVNGNKKCDADEPFALTKGLGAGEEDSFGQYSIVIDPTLYPDPGKFPIFVEVPSTAVDKDTGGAVGKDFTLSAPPGKPEFVSPITTLVHQQLEKNPVLTTEEAEKAVKDRIGVGEQVSLFTDYVKEKSNAEQPAAEEFARVHKVAQVVARTMGDLQAQVKEAATSANIDLNQNLDAIVKLVVEEVMNRLTTIVTKVEEAETSQTPFNPDAVTESVRTESASSTTETITNIATKIEEQKAVIVKSSFQAMLEGEGTYWLSHWFDGPAVRFEYGNVKLVDGQPMDNHHEWNGTSWIPSTYDSESEYILRDGTWKPFSDDASSYSVVFNADGSATLTHKEAGLKEVLRAVEVDLGGKPHTLVAGEQLELLLDPAKTFPAGAKGYRMNFMPMEDIYSVYSWLNDQGQDQNYIIYWDGSSEQAVTSLEQLKQAFAKDSDRYVEIQWTDKGYQLAGQFGANGVLHLFERPWDWKQPAKLLEKTGTWTQVTVQNVPMIKVTIPDTYRANYQVREIPFFVVKDGKVRRGEFSPGNVVEVDSEININKMAFDSLLGNMNFDYTPPTDQGTGGTNTGTGGTDTGTGGTDTGTGGTDTGTGGTGTDPGTYPGALVNVQTVFEGETLYEFEAWFDEFSPFLEYSAIQSDNAGGIVESEYEYDFDLQSWSTLSPPAGDYTLTASGWVQADDLPQDYDVLYNTDGTATLTHKTNGQQAILAISEMDFQGMRQTDIFPGGAGFLVDPSLVFPAGAKGYRTTFTYVNDKFEVEVDDQEFGDNNFVVEKSIYDPNDPFATISMDSLANIPVIHGTGSVNYLDLSQVGKNYGPESLHVQFGADGSVNCFSFQQVMDPNGPSYVWTEVPLEFQGSWAIQSVHGQNLLMIHLPPEHAGKFGVHGTPFIAEIDGVFKYGTFLPAGYVEYEGQAMLNQSAYDSLLGNLNLSPTTATQP